MDKKKYIRFIWCLFAALVYIGIISSNIAQAVDKVGEKDLFFEIEVDNASPVERTMVLYTARLYDGVGIIKSVVSPPSMDNGKIYPLFDEPDKKVKEVNGREYIVLEFRYAVFPEISGNLVINPPKFSGMVYGKVLRGKPIFKNANGSINTRPYKNVLTDTPRKVDINANPVKLRVLPSFGSYMVGESLIVSDTWVPDENMVEVGQILNRNITVKMKGANPEVLPSINLVDVNGFKIYSNKIVSSVEFDKYDITAEFSQSSVYVPEKEGKYVIPKIEIKWTQSDTGENKVFVVPEKKVEVFKEGTKPVIFPMSLVEEEKEDNFFISVMKKWAKINDSSGFFESFFVSIIISFIAILFLRVIIKSWNKFMSPPSAALGEDNREKAARVILNKEIKKQKKD